MHECESGSCVDGRTDSDGDGFPASADCDDHDSAIGPGSTIGCSTDCGNGTQTCANGRWDACSAPTECECVPGDTRDEPCGNCGFASRACTDGAVWAADTEGCEGDGECEPGAVAQEVCDQCGLQTRVCSEACEWGELGKCLSAGDGCALGNSDVQSCGNCGTQTRVCSELCMWGPWGTCEGQEDCAPNATDSEACGPCGRGTTTRTCLASCLWGPFGACNGGGPCDCDGDCDSGLEEGTESFDNCPDDCYCNGNGNCDPYARGETRGNCADCDCPDNPTRSCHDRLCCRVCEVGLCSGSECGEPEC